MPDLLDAAKEVDGYCRGRGWRHCIIGGMALLRWGDSWLNSVVATSVSEWSLIRSLTLAATPTKPKQASGYLAHRK